MNHALTNACARTVEKIGDRMTGKKTFGVCNDFDDGGFSYLA